MSDVAHHRRVSFEKYSGAADEFLVVDADDYVPDRASFARAHCDRETGVEAAGARRRGADGALFLALEAEYSPPRVVMTLLRPDGRTAAMCGDGARCAAAWVADRTGASEVMVDTQAGTRRAVVRGDEVTVEMGVPSFAPADVPLAGGDPLVEAPVAGLDVTAVDAGAPHAVAFVEDVDAVDLGSAGLAVDRADAFPAGANVTVAAPDGDGFVQRTRARDAAAEAGSCAAATGAVAVVAAAKRLGRVAGDDPVRVGGRCGDLAVAVPDRGPATLGGPITPEFDGEAERLPRP